LEHATPRIAALALFMRVTAARTTQAISVEWEKVDLRAATAIIPISKKHPERIARLTPELVAALANLIPEGKEPKGRVFGYERRWSVYEPWKAACEAAGIPYVPPHSAGRRAFATSMARAKVDPKTAAGLGGWKSIRLMLEIYTDADESPDIINSVFSQKLGMNGSYKAEESPAEDTENQEKSA
jgi:integrase